MKLFCITLAFAVLCGCQYDPHSGHYTTYEPTTEEIVGDYELDQTFMESHSPGIGAKVSKLSAPPLIRLLPDGTFIAERFPYFSETRTGIEYKFEDFRSINAKWSQTPVGSIGDGSGTTKTHYGITVDTLPSHLSSFGFTGSNKVDGLIIGFGDPDSGDAITFKKITEQDGGGQPATRHDSK
jgi:hypothetical protein